MVTIFLNENVKILIKNSVKFVPNGPFNNNPALVQIMAGADQATSHYLNQWWSDHRRIYASLGLNELKMSSYQYRNDWGDESWNHFSIGWNCMNIHYVLISILTSSLTSEAESVYITHFTLRTSSSRSAMGFVGPIMVTHHEAELSDKPSTGTLWMAGGA